MVGATLAVALGVSGRSVSRRSCGRPDGVGSPLLAAARSGSYVRAYGDTPREEDHVHRSV
jgi:hypothetical protein